MSTHHQTTPPPLLQIVHGHPTPEQIAALLTVLTTHTTTPTPTHQPTPPRSQWANHQHRMRRPLHPSPNGWRASAFAAGPL